MCPLCKAMLNDDATRLTEAICTVLRDAKLNQAESRVLLDALIQCRLEKSSHSAIASTIEETSPKAVGLKRFLPPGDVAGVLALLIAILSLANDLVFDWIVPALGKPGGGTSEHDSTGRQPPRQIKISSFKLHGERSEARYSHVTGYIYYRYPLHGTWEAGQGCNLVLACYYSNEMFRHNPRAILREICVSTTPGTRWSIELLSSPREKLMFALYILTSDDRLTLDALNMQRAAEMDVLAFQLSFGPGDVARVKPIPIERFIECFNSFVEWYRDDSR
jgi:hypothetical protein